MMTMTATNSVWCGGVCSFMFSRIVTVKLLRRKEFPIPYIFHWNRIILSESHYRRTHHIFSFVRPRRSFLYGERETVRETERERRMHKSTCGALCRCDLETCLDDAVHRLCTMLMHKRCEAMRAVIHQPYTTFYNLNSYKCQAIIFIMLSVVLLIVRIALGLAMTVTKFKVFRRSASCTAALIDNASPRMSQASSQLHLVRPLP